MGWCQGPGKTKTWSLWAQGGGLARWVGWAEVCSQIPGTTQPAAPVSLGERRHLSRSLAFPSVKGPRSHWPILWADGLLTLGRWKADLVAHSEGSRKLPTALPTGPGPLSSCHPPF